MRVALMLKGGGVVSIVGAGGKTTLMYRIAHELTAQGDAVLTTTTTKILRPSVDQSPRVIIASSAAAIIRQAGVLLKKNRHLTVASGENQRGKLTGVDPRLIDELHRSAVFRWIIVEADGASRMPLKAPADHEPVIPESSGWVVGVAGLDAVGKPARPPYLFRPERFARVTGVQPGDTVTTASVASVMIHESGIMKGTPPGAKKLVFLNKADTVDRRAAGKEIAGLLRRHVGGEIQKVVIGTALKDRSF